MILCPYITEILPDNYLAGKRCFIIGGGPSLINFNESTLKDEFVIGVNKAFDRFSPQINYCNDKIFYDMMITPPVDPPRLAAEFAHLSEAWRDYKGLKVFSEMIERQHFRDVILVRQILEHEIKTDLSNGMYSGNNSGFGAIMLAIGLGCKEIYLLGFDLKTKNAADDGKDQTHWHEGYVRQTPRTLQKRLWEFGGVFGEFAGKFINAGIDVVNLSPDSDLTCFRTDTAENVLK